MQRQNRNAMDEVKQGKQLLAPSDSVTDIMTTVQADEFVLEVFKHHPEVRGMSQDDPHAIGIVSAFVNAAINMLDKDRDLLVANPQQVYRGLIDAAHCGLMPGPAKHFYLVAFQSCIELIIDARGWIHMVRNIVGLDVIYANVVREKDVLVTEEGTERTFSHKWNMLVDRGAMVGVCAFAKLKGGNEYWATMDMEEIERHKNASPSVSSRTTGSSPWDKWYEEMARKSVLKKLMYFLPTSDTMVGYALDVDQRIEDADNPADRSGSENIIDLTPEPLSAQAAQTTEPEPEATQPEPEPDVEPDADPEPEPPDYADESIWRPIIARGKKKGYKHDDLCEQCKTLVGSYPNEITMEQAIQFSDLVKELPDLAAEKRKEKAKEKAAEKKAAKEKAEEPEVDAAWLLTQVVKASNVMEWSDEELKAAMVEFGLEAVPLSSLDVDALMEFGRHINKKIAATRDPSKLVPLIKV